MHVGVTNLHPCPECVCPRETEYDDPEIAHDPVILALRHLYRVEELAAIVVAREPEHPPGGDTEALRETVAELAALVARRSWAACVQCGGTYLRERSTRQYCSDICRQAAHRARNAKGA